MTYLARFSYDVLPANRQRAVDFIRQEVEAAKGRGLNARLLVPLTRRPNGAALQFEVELASLDQLGACAITESTEQTESWMRAFSEVLLRPPEVELLRQEST